MPTLSAVRALGATLPKSLTAALLGACRKLMKRRPRRTAVALDRFDDRLLRDIGISRSDLMATERLTKSPKRSRGR
ncbi:DUF1127 domain-containing protein [Azospirillum argentinense]